MQAHAPCVPPSLLQSVTIPCSLLPSVMWSLLQSATFIAILWHLSVRAVSKQIRRFKDYICAKADHVTERIVAHGIRIIDAMDVTICAEPPPSNDVCRIVEQATHAAQGRWLPLCVAWAMLHSVNVLFSMLFNEPEAFASTVVR